MLRQGQMVSRVLRTRRVTFTAAMSIWLSANSVVARTLPAQDATTQHAVTQRVQAYFSAMGSGNTSVLEQSLAPDYVVIGGDGKMETRAERLAWLRSNAKNLLALTPSEVRVRVYGLTAVATGLVTIPQDHNTPAIKERFTQVWIQRRGVWKMVSGQITIVKQ